MIPTDRKYSKTHEWVKVDGPIATIGISAYAQDALGDITFVELPSSGKHVRKEAECGVIESVKAASEIYSPLTGDVAETNEQLETTPEDINQDPYGKGWLFTIKNLKNEELSGLMDAAAYQAFLDSQE